MACDGCIYAVGGWYLDSLVAPDSNTALYTAVERYDPWEDTWRFVTEPQAAVLQPHSTKHGGLEAVKVECDPPSRFVSSLPLSDFRFTVSLSHDVPLAASLAHCLYVLGSVQRTGEKLLLQYDTREGMKRQQLTRISP